MPRMAHRLTLLTVHAHPDDETITTGGVMARYADEGLRVVCVTCTGGELGEIVVPEMDTPENHERLGTIRAGEMARALAGLSPDGRIEHRWLGYRDSGMMGTEGNADPRSFWQADAAEASARLEAIVREVEADVIVGYNDFGGYGHPDHIRAALIAKSAFEATAGHSGPAKLYESVLQWSRMEAVQKRARRARHRVRLGARGRMRARRRRPSGRPSGRRWRPPRAPSPPRSTSWPSRSARSRRCRRT